MTDNDQVYIICGVTLHLPGKNFNRRVEMRDAFPCALGPDEITVAEAGSPVGPFPRDEALSLIARFGGEIISHKDK